MIKYNNKENGIMYQITTMAENEIYTVMDLWYTNYSEYCNKKITPDFFPNGKEKMEIYLKEQINKGNAIIIKENDTIFGYFSWIFINFHNENTMFCPIIGHVAIGNGKENIYSQLYKYVSSICIKNSVFNHLWMIFNDDILLKKFSYDMGFGSYVMDAYIKNGIMAKNDCPYKIIMANKNDCNILYDLVEESRNYYHEAPIFLNRKTISEEKIREIIEQNIVFVAWDNNIPIGFINIKKDNQYNIETLETPESVDVSPLGIYIKEEYRRKGIGKKLVEKIFKYCNKNTLEYIHVSFETANPFANNFWKRYFSPVIISVRRTVKKDINM
jgi:GNAT superfamily N-acetyltransferase